MIRIGDLIVDSLLAEEKAGLIMTNIPFGRRRGERIALEQVLQMLHEGGRAAIIVPEGLLFNSTEVYKSLRQKLIKENTIEAIISLPSDVFHPHTTCKCSILFLTKGGTTEEVWFYRVDSYDLNLQESISRRPEINGLWDMRLKYSLRFRPQRQPSFVNDETWEQLVALYPDRRSRSYFQLRTVKQDDQGAATDTRSKIPLKKVEITELPEPKDWLVSVQELCDNYFILSALQYQPSSFTPEECKQRLIHELQTIEKLINTLLKVEANEQQLTLLQEPPTKQIEWRDCKLRDVITGLESARSIRLKDIPAEAGKWGILKVNSVSTGIFQPNKNKGLSDDLPMDLYKEYEKYEVQDEDLIINRANSAKFIGASVIVRTPPKRLIISDKLWRVVLTRPLQTDIYFLYVLLNTPHIRRQMLLRSWGTLGSMLHITKGAFLNIDITLPPEPIQKAFRVKFCLFWQMFAPEYTTSPQQLVRFNTLLTQIFKGTFTIEWWERYKQQEELPQQLPLFQ